MKPRSILEGVPFPVKDLMDALPYETTSGCAYVSLLPAAGFVAVPARSLPVMQLLGHAAIRQQHSNQCQNMQQGSDKLARSQPATLLLHEYAWTNARLVGFPGCTTRDMRIMCKDVA